MLKYAFKANPLQFINLLLIILLTCTGNINANLNAFDEDDEDSEIMPKRYKYVWDFAVATMFQNEAPYLKEWIEFHKLAGAQHFYLYNNFSTDDYLSVLQPYIDSGEVELFDWPYTYNSTKEFDTLATNAFRNALVRARGKAKWLGMLDSDEFLYVVNGKKVQDYLAPLLDKKIGGVLVHWYMFGTSNVAKVPKGKLMIEMLTLSAGKHELYKSIYRPEYVKKIENQHYCTYKYGYVHKFEDDLNLPKIRINHYWSRDEDFFYNVKVPRRIAYGTSRETSEAWNAAMNAFPDYTIQPYVLPLRAKMEFR
jgi:hypothetical protein